MSLPTKNQRIVLRKAPTGHIDPSLEGNGTYIKDEQPVPELQDGEVLVKILYVSVDPAMRGWLDQNRRSYAPPVPEGSVMRSLAVGTVIASKSSDVSQGETVSGQLGWQEYAVAKGKEVNKLPKGLEPWDALGMIGIAGQTAYWGFLEVAAPKEGDVVVVTGAAGSVGSLVVQMAKIKKCKVIAVAGGAEKCKWLKEELKADIVLDYKSESMEKFQETYHETLKKEGWADILFENVGGPLLDTSLLSMKPQSRISMCGMISSYNGNPYAFKNLANVVMMRIRMQGFIVTDFMSRYGESTQQLAQWAKEGKLVCKMDIVEGGVDKCPQSLVDLFEGKNTGKRVVQIAA